MTICRYFLQGNCRFGDRCRFEHTDPDAAYQEETPRRSNYNDRGSYNDGYNRRNYNAYDNRSYNYDRRNEYTPHEDRYQQNYNQYNQRHTSERRYQSERYGPGNYENDSSYGHGNRFGQNKHEWVSEDYRRQREQRKNTEEFYNTSTPKSNVNFSFKDPELHRRTDHTVDLRLNDQNLVYVDLIKEEMKQWELGSQWPFTCYSPIQERSSFPGFNDVSPEELRYEAYKARENNAFNSYVASVEKALKNINNRRNQLKNPSVELMSIIEKYRTGQDVTAESEVDGIFPFSRSSQSPIEDMLADESSLQQNAASSFSFKLPPTSGSSMKIGASNFSFKLPSETGSKPSSQAMDTDIYTPLEKLSSADKEQFSASTFTLGKIPTVPPPQEVCF
ncbi:unnamed protein product [Larinioides sclopetarius]|uniref:Nucleoporin NUP42 n=2 Tax=Larinioides sclopetarius TaxID=280406 RepID=A0AAV2B300_9ARAC